MYKRSFFRRLPAGLLIRKKNNQKRPCFPACILLLLLSACVLAGCGGLKEPEPGTGTWNNTPQVLTPSADGTFTYGNDRIHMDASHTDQGYVILSYTGEVDKIKVQISGPTNITYTYNLSPNGEAEVFPLTQGSGNYTCSVFEHAYDSQYTQAFTQQFEVALENEFLPFLYPNQYINYNEDTKAVALAQELSETADDELDVIASVYYYVVTNLTYDYEKAETVQSGYLPDIDDTLATKTGICFDYAALMTCMLRTQGIPTMLDIGYTGGIYHAWISTYVKEKGWIYNIIEFDGQNWKLMDPTFASTENSSRKIMKYINNPDNYFTKYSY